MQAEMTPAVELHLCHFWVLVSGELSPRPEWKRFRKLHVQEDSQNMREPLVVFGLSFSRSLSLFFQAAKSYESSIIYNLI